MFNVLHPYSSYNIDFHLDFYSLAVELKIKFNNETKFRVERLMNGNMESGKL